MNDRLARQWAEFDARVIPPDAPDVQRVEMRRAFFAGAWTMFTQMTGRSVTEVPDEQSEAVLQSLHDECVAFQQSLLRGEA